MGYSFGGYCAPRIAALDTRYAGGVAFGAMWWDMHAWLVRSQEQMKKGALATSHFQVPWVFGVPDLDFSKAVGLMKNFTLDGIAQKVTCPFLVMHGKDDGIIPPEEAEILYEKLGSKNKALKIFDAKEGAAQHCQVDDRPAGINFIGRLATAGKRVPMSTEPKCGNWVEHFPGNAKWSNAIQIVKGMAPYGAVSLEEVDRVGARMTARAGEGDLDTVWRRNGARMADAVASLADQARG